MMTENARRIALSGSLAILFALSPRTQAQGLRYSSQPVVLGAGGYQLDFGILWTCDDDPNGTSSAPGVIDLVDAGGNLAGEVVATANHSGPVVTASGAGAVSNVSLSVNIYGAGGTPADGYLHGTWNISGPVPGPYTLRFWFNQRIVAGNPLSLVSTDALDAGGGGEVGGPPAPTPAPVPAPTPVPIPAPSPTPAPTPVPLFFTLSVSASPGGTANGGGTYPANAQATAVATASPGNSFAGWTGDLTGAAQSLLVLMDSNKAVVAHFVPLLAQTISFVPPGNVSIRSPAFPLSVSASSGLPVTLLLDSGPVALSGGVVTPAGFPGQAVLTATQPGNAQYLPAPPLLISFPIGPAQPGVLYADDSSATKRSDRETRTTSYTSGPSR